MFTLSQKQYTLVQRYVAHGFRMCGSHVVIFIKNRIALVDPVQSTSDEAIDDSDTTLNNEILEDQSCRRQCSRKGSD